MKEKKFMNYEYLKKEFIKLKKEELIYIDNISKISSNKILPEYEKLEFLGCITPVGNDCRHFRSGTKSYYPNKIYR